MSAVPYWVSSLPDGWSAKRVKFATSILNSNVDKKSYEGDTVVRLCNYTDVYYNDYITEDMELMKATATGKEIEKFTLQAGDIIITKDSEMWNDIAIPAYVSKDMPGIVCGYHLALLRCESEANGYFLFRALQATGIREQFWISANGVTRYGLGLAGIGNALIPLPPLPTQQLIATYLDRKTQAIDALITAREEQIARLQEKRASLIHRAVTKGITEGVEMKDSGIEWIGEIPKHWSVRRLRFSAVIQNSNVDKKSYEGDTAVRLCNYTDVYYNDYITEDMELMKATATDKEIEKFTLQAGDIIITKDSEMWNDIAIPAYVSKDMPGIVCGYHLSMIRHNKDMNGEYLFRLFQTAGIKDQFYIAANGVTRYGLGQMGMKDSLMLKPPLDEQGHIVKYIQVQASIIDKKIELIQKSIPVIKEYRQSLITEAVTGKLDPQAMQAYLGKPSTIEESV